MVEKIKQIIAAQAGLKDTSTLTPETSLESLGLDSLDAAEILIALEDEFEIELLDEAFFNVKTLGDVIYYFKQQLN